MKTRIAVLLVALLISFTAFGAGKGGEFDALMETARAEGTVRVIVQLDLGAGGAQLSEEAEASAIRAATASLLSSAAIEPLVGINIRNVTEYDFIPFLAAEVDPVGLEALARHSLVTEVGEDGENEPFLKQSVPKIMGVTNPWTAPPMGATGQGWYVAILDTGIDRYHTMFRGKVIREACYKARTNCPNGQKSMVGVGAARPVHYHGTHVAGIAAGRYMPSRRFGGVAHRSNIVAVNVFETTPITAFDSSVLKGMNHVYNLRRLGVKIAAVNLSLGKSVPYSQACDNTDTFHQAFKAAAEKLKKKKVATVVATGNDYYKGAIASPACVSNAISVGNSTKWDGMSPSTNNAPIMDLFAPGHSIYSALPGNRFGYLTGTSMATPHIVGAFALLKQKFPAASVTALRTAIQASGKDLKDSRSGAPYLWAPRVRVKEALKNVGAYVRSTAVGFNNAASLDRFERHSGNWSVASWWAGATGVAKSFGRAGYRNFLQLHHNYLNGSVGVKMRRALHPSHNNSANTLIIRTTGPTGSFAPKNTYLLQYTNTGQVSVWKRVDGELFLVKDWYTEPKVNKGGWNILLATTGGKYVKFYINGKLVASFSDPALVYGRPGVAFWRESGTTATSFGVDWIYARRAPSNPITYYGDGGTQAEAAVLEVEDSAAVQSGPRAPTCAESPAYCQ